MRGNGARFDPTSAQPDDPIGDDQRAPEGAEVDAQDPASIRCAAGCYGRRTKTHAARLPRRAELGDGDATLATAALQSRGRLIVQQQSASNGAIDAPHYEVQSADAEKSADDNVSKAARRLGWYARRVERMRPKLRRLAEFYD